MTKSKHKGRGGARPGAGRPPKPKAPPVAPENAGVDPALVDPDRILAAIAIDDGAPAGARVAACRALKTGRPRPPAPTAGPDDDIPDDALSRRALALMASGGRRAN